MNKSFCIRRVAIGSLFLLFTAPLFAADETIRVATYNTSLFRDTDGQLIADLEKGDNEQARKIAEVIQRVRPDILFVNEFDYDADGRAAELFRSKYLEVGQNGQQPIKFDNYFTGPVNTGVPSGRDLGHNGKTGQPDDAFGFGRHPGQYGMLVLSKFPIARDQVRTFQKFLWHEMPNAKLPVIPKTGKPFYDNDDLAILRLSSKSFWDVPIELPSPSGRGQGEGALAKGAKPQTLHLLCSHPTPPVFDGPEDRNGCRNHDEVRLIADYISREKGDYLVDDAGKRGGIAKDAEFVIVGDLNCDPVDGAAVPGTMQQLLENPRVNNEFAPTSEGGPLTVKKFPDQFKENKGNPARVTSNFTEEGHGCLRIDYVLPSRGLEIAGGAIFWPKPGDPGSEAITATDHRSAYIDIKR
jgi:endonuclease/exonuclease/phosphatase family metal-dependent hydrolase